MTCNHVIVKDFTTYFEYCSLCGTVVDEVGKYVDEYRDRYFMTWDRFYVKSNYNMILIHSCHNIFNKNKVPLYLSAKTIISILEKLDNVCTWKNVYDAYKIHSCIKFTWPSFGYYIDKELIYKKEVLKECNTILNDLSKYHKLLKWDKSPNINFWYVLYKLHDIYNVEKEWIPLKCSKNILERYEKRWEQICELNEYPFKKIPRTKKGKCKPVTIIINKEKYLKIYRKEQMHNINYLKVLEYNWSK